MPTGIWYINYVDVCVMIQFYLWYNLHGNININNVYETKENTEMLPWVMMNHHRYLSYTTVHVQYYQSLQSHPDFTTY